MEVTIRAAEQNPKVVVVKLAGHLDSHTAPPAATKMLAALEQSAAGVILDLGALDFISSAGISALIDTQKKAKAAGKQVALIHTHPSTYKIFKIAALDKVFKFYEEEADALQALWPPPPGP